MVTHAWCACDEPVIPDVLEHSWDGRCRRCGRDVDPARWRGTVAAAVAAREPTRCVRCAERFGHGREPATLTFTVTGDDAYRATIPTAYLCVGCALDFAELYARTVREFLTGAS